MHCPFAGADLQRAFNCRCQSQLPLSVTFAAVDHLAPACIVRMRFGAFARVDRRVMLLTTTTQRRAAETQ